MCIMQVRPGQHTATIAQACAHNASTIDRDLEMFKALIVARGQTAELAKLDKAMAHIHAGYEALYTIFADEIMAEVQNGDHDHDAEHGSERIERHADHQLIAHAMAVATHRAERYEER